MFIIQLHYLVDISIVEKYVSAHRDYLELFFNKGQFLVSGPMVPRTGGVIVATNIDRATLDNIIENDPYYLANIARYEVTEFSPVKFRPEIKALI